MSQDDERSATYLSQQYLPPLDPRNPAVPGVDYGTPDVSVQGLPTQEQQPIFQGSPVHGQPSQGPGFQSDIRNLDQSLQQNQYQQQQEIYRQFQKQKQLEAAQAKSKGNSLPSPKAPRPFARTTPAPSTTAKAEPTTEAPASQVTEANLNEREILEDDGPSAELKQRTSVEVSKQNIQQYPGEFYLSSLAQLQLQPQFVPLQQIRNSYLQPIQAEKQVGFDGPAHFAALPSVLAQQQASPQPLPQSPALLIGEQAPNPGFIVQQPLAQHQPAAAYQPVQAQYQPAVQPQAAQPEYLQTNPDAVAVQPVQQYQPVAYQPQVAPLPQIQVQPVVLQPQSAPQPQGKDREEIENQGDNSEFQAQQVYQQPQQVYQQPQQVYQQPQQVYQQPQQVYQQPEQVYQQPQQVFQQPEQVYQQPQQFYQQPIIVSQNQAPQQLYPAPLNNQGEVYEGQFQPQIIPGAQPQNFQGQDALQSGLDANQEGNDIDQAEEQESEEDDEGTRSTAVATVFGARTQPRVFTQYGAPFPVPRVQAKPSFTTTESPVEEVTEEGPAIAQAVAVASRQKNAKLRRNRIRPVFTVDRSGHLVLAPGQ
ncbi:hypothetical protein O3G_MSEX003201 [Manduca sexta]|uniref:Uncharacterized protein n=1 Tax=Manduca sexta TaxID=7130 RepID=A0A921YS49_MANSE|nr:hypothetical protein O3G_MSEX003201 [Manduca sexta]